MIGEPLVSDRRLEQVEDQIRREFPGLPDGAKFVTYEQAPTQAETNGIEVPIPATAVAAIFVPNPKWPAQHQPQYRAVRGAKLLSHWRDYEKHAGRLVAAPDQLLGDFRTIARRAVQMAADMRELA